MDEDEDDDPQPDPDSTLYYPFPWLRLPWLNRLGWWQKALLFVGALAAMVVIALLATIRIIP